MESKQHATKVPAAPSGADSAEGGVQMHPGFLVRPSSLGAENPPGFYILTRKGSSRLPFPLELLLLLPEFCPFMARQQPPTLSVPLSPVLCSACEVSVIFGHLSLPSRVSQLVRSSVSLPSVVPGIGRRLAADHLLDPRGLIRGSNHPERGRGEQGGAM